MESWTFRVRSLMTKLHNVIQGHAWLPFIWTWYDQKDEFVGYGRKGCVVPVLTQ